MKRLLVPLVVVLCVASAARAQSQTTCAQTLRLAQSIYDQGRLHELPQLLQGCLERNDFNKEEKVAAYKLLALTYIYLEEPAKADDNMLKLLRTDTEFTVNDALDPAEFVALYKTFRTSPIYRIGGKLGGVAAAPSVKSADYIDDGTNNMSHGFGFSGSITSEIPLRDKLNRFTLAPEINFQILSFKGVNENGDTARVTPSTENHMWVSVPVSVQYSLRESSNKLSSYYVALGLSADYLISSTKTITSSREGNSAIDENTISIAEQRNAFNAGALFSAGVKRRLGKGFLFFEVRYKLGLLPISKPSHTYENSVLTFDYKYVDGIYKLNTLSLSTGYVINRYNPKKLSR